MSELLKKLLLSLLPFLSGVLVRIYMYAPKISFAYIYLPELLFSIISAGILMFCYYLFSESIWENNATMTPMWFDYKIHGITPYLFIIPTSLAIILLPFTTASLSAFLRTIIIGVVVEELLSRSIFIVYSDMSNRAFLILGTLSNCAFSLNHWLYDLEYYKLPMHQQFEKFLMHFVFGIMLSGIVFKSKKLELSIFRHMFSNANVYLWRYSSTLGLLSGMIWHALDYLNLIGFGVTKKSPRNNSRAISIS